jgi:hypothetical protein
VKTWKAATVREKGARRVTRKYTPSLAISDIFLTAYRHTLSIEHSLIPFREKKDTPFRHVSNRMYGTLAFHLITEKDTQSSEIISTRFFHCQYSNPNRKMLEKNKI